MNHFLLFAILLLGSLIHDDCESFYKKTLYPIEIKGSLTMKEEQEDYFIFHIKNEDGKNITLKLLKNKTGKRIFNAAREKCQIFKSPNRYSISVVNFYDDETLFVEKFPDPCE